MTDICCVCPLAKQTCLPFSSSTNCTHDMFELIHCDLWGPYRTTTRNGCQYFITVVDDFSRSFDFLSLYKAACL